MSPASLSSPVEPAAEEQAQASVLQTLLATAQHFFGGFARLFAGVSESFTVSCRSLICSVS